MKFSQQFFSNSFFEQDNTKLELTDLARKAWFHPPGRRGALQTASSGWTGEPLRAKARRPRRS